MKLERLHFEQKKKKDYVFKYRSIVTRLLRQLFLLAISFNVLLIFSDNMYIRNLYLHPDIENNIKNPAIFIKMFKKKARNRAI